MTNIAPFSRIDLVKIVFQCTKSNSKISNATWADLSKIATHPYTPDFFKSELAGSYVSAKHIVPAVLDIVPARSVLDVGCGTGHFLRAFAEAGAADIQGIDGDYVPRDQLAIEPHCFQPVELAGAFDLGRTFDLAVSLEVAEHLPPESAEDFVASLVRHASSILFSAAIPLQGGTGHLNEQWPSYWAGLFAKHGFAAYDCLRSGLWSQKEVEWWYRQNILLFCNEEGRAASDRLLISTPTRADQLDRVHPDLYIQRHLGFHETLQRTKEAVRSAEAEPVAKRLAIVVPYRDRAEHREQFIPHLTAYFQRDKLDSQIPVSLHFVEQAGDAPFNRGKLCNVGYMLAREDADYVCFHDVDYLPIWADYSWPENPARLIWHGLSLQESWESFFGAVVMFKNPDFELVNGFPNSYWGWGAEDRELRERCNVAGLGFDRRDGTFRGLPHEHAGFSSSGVHNDVAARNTALRLDRQKDFRDFMVMDGLSSLSFELLSREPVTHNGQELPNAVHHLVEIGGPQDG